MDISNLNNVSDSGWKALTIMAFFIVIGIGIIAASMIIISKRKNIKTRFFETSETKELRQARKELDMAEGKDLLDNQCQVAKNILKELRVKIYETAVKQFEMLDRKDLAILNHMTHRITDRLNYDVKNDLTRNHITRKTNYELEQYIRAKARGYFSVIKDRLYQFNNDMPEYNLPEIMDLITLQEVEVIFKDVYFSARRIAGNNGEERSE